MKENAAEIPMVDLAAQHAALEAELLEGFSSILRSGHFVLGRVVESFERALAKRCDLPHARSCNSGTDALWLALRALDVGPGDAVLCPAYSFFSTASAIALVGAEPVFCDIDPATLTLDPEDALRRAERLPNLRAIVTVDLFGRIAETGVLDAYCAAREIPIIQDAAQSIGALDPMGRPPGHAARIATLSFYPTKNLGALGDAGAIVTHDEALARRVEALRAHGEGVSGLYEEIGLNSRMDAIHAMALQVKLRHLERWTAARCEWASLYDALFADQGARPSSRGDRTSDVLIETPAPVDPPAFQTYHRYVIRVPAGRREGLKTRLASEGIASEIYYPRGIHHQPAIRGLARSPSTDADPRLPETERACAETLALPLYPEMGKERVERVVDAVVRALRT